MRIISEDLKDIIKDEDKDKIIMATKRDRYLGQLIHNRGLSGNTIETKIFGKIMSILWLYNRFDKTIKIRIFKTYLISKINHMIPLIALSNNLNASS